MPRVVGWSYGGGRFLMSEEPLYSSSFPTHNMRVSGITHSYEALGQLGQDEPASG